MASRRFIGWPSGCARPNRADWCDGSGGFVGHTRYERPSGPNRGEWVDGADGANRRNRCDGRDWGYRCDGHGCGVVQHVHDSQSNEYYALVHLVAR